ncbi:GNAT family N-acetyltransferase [Phycicoccus sp. Soil802]|uniref:GNAT family N-acetyltransferase n=1 Tax=Phycicoccus sp. Soil802 TaxID=1736414 RepID=UPI000A6991C6
MPTPDFVLALRERLGHDLLWMAGVTAVVRDERGHVLLGRRTDNGLWGLVSGILEPGEQPADGLLREIEEETGVVARIEALAGVWTQPEVTYPNGDRAQYLDLCFLARHVSGEARVNDDESTEVGWFPVDALPEGLAPNSRHKLATALAFDGRTRFEGDGVGGGYAAGPGTAARPPLAVLDPGDVVLRRAGADDVRAIVGLIADDQLGATREDPGDLTAYLRAFAAIDADPSQLLVVLDDGGTVVGTLQLSFLPGLSRRGAMRGQVEAVRVAATHRGRRLGEQLVRWAVDESARRGCGLVQLTTDKSRADAHRLYERLGFTASHEGFKMSLDVGTDRRGEEHR